MAAPSVTVLSGIITPALQDLLVYQTGENVSAADSAVALQSLNAMIDSWGAEDLTMFQVARQVFPLTANQQDYEMGPGAEFDAPRPSVINNAGIILTPLGTPAIEEPISILDDDQWAMLRLKPLLSTFPTAVYPNYTYPNATLSFYPIPQSDGYSVALYIPQAVTAFADISSTVSAPPGYLEAMEYNLALRLAPKFGRLAPQTVVVAAKQALDKIKSRNSAAPLLTSDAPIGRRSGWSIYTDGYGPFY